MDRVENTELWEEHSSFFQANTIKGARYLDDAGKIINDYAGDFHDFSVGLNGLRFAKPKKEDLPDEIVVDVNRIWIASYGQGCIKKIRESAEAITKAVSRHIGVDSYSRLGFRIYYFRVMKDVKSYTQEVCSKIIASELQTLVGPADKVLEIISRVRFQKPPFYIRLGVQPVTIVRPPERISEFPGDGVVIDIDVYEDNYSSKRSLNLKHLSNFLRESSDCIVAKAGETVTLLKGVEKSAK